MNKMQEIYRPFHDGHDNKFVAKKWSQNFRIGGAT